MRTIRTTVRLLILTLIASSLAVVTLAPAANAGASIKVLKVKGGLRGPAGFTFLPGGKLLYAERGTGQIRILNLETKHTRRFFTIAGVNGAGERGALGVAVHPAWPDQPFVYVFATRNAGGNLRNQIVRIRANKHDGAWKGVGMKVLLSAPASNDPYHNGGRIEFGPDGRLYAIVGDGHNSTNAQDVTGNLRGKILRLRADGGVPADNPMIGGERTRMFAYGIRNSFGFAFDPDTGDLWETENGPGCNDEVNRIVAGENYGWGPSESCPNTNNSGPSPRLPVGHLRLDDRHHRRRVLRRMRAGRGRGGPVLGSVLRRWQLAPRGPERATRRLRQRGHRLRRARRFDLLDGAGAERTHLLQRQLGHLPVGSRVGLAQLGGGAYPRSIMDIGQPKRIIEITPAAIPVPGELVPDLAPDMTPEREPEREPQPAGPESADRRSR